MQRCLPVYGFITILLCCIATGITAQTNSDTLRGNIVSKVISDGKKYVGKPYRYHAEGHTLDCSGFVSLIYAKNGISLSASCKKLAGEVQRIGMNMVEAGDLLFFRGRRTSSVGHVIMVIGKEGKDLLVMHSCHRGIIIEKYSLSFYLKRFLFAGRVPQLETGKETEDNKPARTL
jgi:cell wall-associated NlpC family hydrolase